MVTPIPQDQPYNVAEQYGRIGQAIQGVADAPLKAVSGMQTFQANELTMTKAQQAIEKEKQRIADLEAGRIKLSDYKKEKAIQIAGSEEALNAILKEKKPLGRVRMGGEGPQPNMAPETAGLKREQVDIIKNLWKADSIDEVKVIMVSAAKVINKYEDTIKKYGKAVTISSPNTAELMTYKEGNKWMNPYGDAYEKQVDGQVNTFLNEGVRDIIESTLKKAKINDKTGLPDVSYQEVMQKVTKDPEFNERAYDPEFITAVKATFDDMWTKEEMRIKEKAATMKGQAQTEKKEEDIGKQFDLILGGINKEIESNNSKMKKAVGDEYKALISTGQWLNPDATSKYTDEQRKALTDGGNKIVELDTKRKIALESRKQGELLRRIDIDNIYEDIKDGSFDTPEGKKYGPLINFKKAGGGAEGAPAEAPAPATTKTPATAASPDEATIQEYMRMYPGKTREQIIKAIERSK